MVKVDEFIFTDLLHLQKHDEIFVDQADRKAHHTVEVLPYLLPPIGIAVLVVLGTSTYMVKKWQKIPNGEPIRLLSILLLT